jgi:hypothetical protein
MPEPLTTRNSTRDDVVETVHRTWWNVDRDLGIGSELFFTDDGTCVMPALTMCGRDEISAGYARRLANGPRLSRHLVSNIVVRITDNHATATYVLSLFAGNGQAPLAVDSPSAICDVDDELVLTEAGWLVHRRELTAVFVAASNDSVMLRRAGSDA